MTNWHDELEGAVTVEEAVAAVKRHLGAIASERLGSLSRHCQPKRIASDEDIDALTFRLSEARRERSPAWDEAAVEEAFDLALHASLRISRLNRDRAYGRVALAWRPQMSQMS